MKPLGTTSFIPPETRVDDLSRPKKPSTTTDWSLIRRAAEDDREALETLCRAYWPAVFAYLQARCRSRERAEDLTQGLFASILERHDLSRLDPTRGRFRGWIRRCALHYLVNQTKHESTLGRGGNARPISLDGDADRSPLDVASPEQLAADRLFDRRWALVVVDRAMDRVRALYEREGRGQVFARLHTMLDADEPRQAGARPLSLVERQRRHRELKEMKKRYGRCLRREVEDIVADPRAIDDELRELFNALS